MFKINNEDIRTTADWPLEISALALASAFQYKYSFLHGINSLQSLRLVLYIFVKHVISNKVATYRLEACDFVRKCSAKIFFFLSRFSFTTIHESQDFQRVYRKVFHELRFIRKTQGCVLQGVNFIKELVHHRLFFLKILFFKTTSFRYIFQKVSDELYRNSKVAI